LKCVSVFHSISASATAVPEIAVEREPEPIFHIVTQVTFERADRFLRLRLIAWKERIVGKELGVRREEPHRRIAIEHPVAPAFRMAEFRFERPAVRAVIDQLRPIVLTGWGHHLQAHAQDGLPLPRLILLDGHCRAALEIHRETKNRIQKAKAVDPRFVILKRSLVMHYTVVQRS